MIPRVAELMGTARPSPTPATAVLMPTTQPRPSTRAPPELPGLRAASVWMTLSTIRAVEAVGIPDRHDELADPERLGISQLGGCQVAAVEPENGEVGKRVGADDLEVDPAAVDEGRIAGSVRAIDDVSGRQREAVGRDHDGASRTVEPAPTANAPRDLQVCDRWREPFGHRRHDPRVGVQRLPVGRERRGSRRCACASSLGADELEIGHAPKVAPRLQAASAANFGASLHPTHPGKRPRVHASGERRTSVRPECAKIAPMAEVETTLDGAVLTITLNRPDVLNAFNRAMHEGLAAALRDARDPEVRAVVLTGAGRGFCVGQDLTEFREAPGDIADRLRETYHPNILAVRSLEKPVIAAVNGPAAGAGLSFAAACDLRTAADSATFVPAFVNIGLVPDSGGT